MEDGHVVLHNAFMSTKEYPTMASVLGPLAVYFNILGAFALSSNNASAVYSILEGSTMYTQQMLDLYVLYDWHAILQYYFAFHLRCRQEMHSGIYAGWAGVDKDSWSKYLHSHERSRVMKECGLSLSSLPSRSSSHTL